MRIGIVAKPDLVDARDTLQELRAWIEARRLHAVWSPEAAALLPAAPDAVADRNALPAGCDLVIVLGGDVPCWRWPTASPAAPPTCRSSA